MQAGHRNERQHGLGTHMVVMWGRKSFRSPEHASFLKNKNDKFREDFKEAPACIVDEQ